ncbi:caspase domain-containing protein [Mycena sp. CBHHK59/15]|nr:caspase domain-containing protein [Mycena sp. CBHHK59/15]
MTRPYFALIIGIDEYEFPTIKNLSGCVNDGKSFQASLTKIFGPAPESAILFLENASATRAAILSSFRTHLIENPQIERGDPIIIYYAGHGSRVSAPMEWYSPSGFVETICPSDESIFGPEGRVIPGIPDRTINALLRMLAGEKGNNITLVCDSCHSGGVARQIADDQQTARRRSGDPSPMPADIDHDILQNANGERQAFGFHGSHSSHVLLAACAEGESAFENTIAGVTRGAFTTALTRQFHLLEYQIRIGRITYSDLMTSLKLPFQHPQCEGERGSGLLFAERNKVSPCVFELTSKNGTLYVAAGEAHGIVEGTEMVIYQEASALTSLGVLVVRDVGAVTAMLGTRNLDDVFTLPENSWARVLRWNAGELKIVSHPSLSPQLPKASSEYRVRQVDLKSARQITLHATEPHGPITIERQHRLRSCTHAICNIMIQPELTDCLPIILNGIAHFHFHLGRQKPPARELAQAPLTSRHVAIEMHRLERRLDDGTMEPHRKNLFKNNVAHLSIDNASCKYGIKIVNTGTYGLFPYLFYFDPSDYSIEALYLPSFTATTPPLEPKSFVTVGYGGSGGAPLRFKPQGDVRDAAFLKVFVSTKNIKLDHIVQSSLFKAPSAPASGGTAHPPTAAPRMPYRRHDDDAFWDVSLATITVGKTISHPFYQKFVRPTFP